MNSTKGLRQATHPKKKRKKTWRTEPSPKGDWPTLLHVCVNTHTRFTLAYVKDGFRLGREALLDVRLQSPEHEGPEDLVQLVDDVLLCLLVVNLEVEPLGNKNGVVLRACRAFVRAKRDTTKEDRTSRKKKEENGEVCKQQPRESGGSQASSSRCAQRPRGKKDIPGHIYLPPLCASPIVGMRHYATIERHRTVGRRHACVPNRVPLLLPEYGTHPYDTRLLCCFLPLLLLLVLLVYLVELLRRAEDVGEKEV